MPATKFLVSLPESLAVELEAFCRLHYGAPRVSVIRRALESYLRDELTRHPELRKEFLEYKSQLVDESPATLRLVGKPDPNKR